MDLTHGLDDFYGKQIIEGFSFRDIHTSDYDMWLVDRFTPPPNEKQIIESLPFAQGIQDFSMILGARVYENRELKYTFEILNRNYQHRKSIETSLTNWLMNSDYSELHDDHAQNYHYIAKCRHVDVMDSAGGLSVEVTFDAYPFKIAELLEGNDIWDTFNFELDVAQVTEFEVNGTTNITLFNVGSNLITPTIEASSDFEITKGNTAYEISSGTTKSESFFLDMGENRLTITGNGIIKFNFYKELL